MNIARNTLLGFLLISPTLWASEINAGRYGQLDTTPTAAQRLPLLAIKTFNFPEDIETVEDAIQFVLNGSGYSTAPRFTSTLPFIRLPLPDIHRLLGPISIAQCLQTLAGTPYQLVIDDISRMITFELIPVSPSSQD